MVWFGHDGVAAHRSGRTVGLGVTAAVHAVGANPDRTSRLDHGAVGPWRDIGSTRWWRSLVRAFAEHDCETAGELAESAMGNERLRSGSGSLRSRALQLFGVTLHRRYQRGLRSDWGTVAAPSAVGVRYGSIPRMVVIPGGTF
jgi:hypothetical protein